MDARIAHAEGLRNAQKEREDSQKHLEDTTMRLENTKMRLEENKMRLRKIAQERRVLEEELRAANHGDDSPTCINSAEQPKPKPRKERKKRDLWEENQRVNKDNGQPCWFVRLERFSDMNNILFRMGDLYDRGVRNNYPPIKYF